MDAVKFLKERRRMCLTYKVCDGCPLQESGMCPDEGENAEAIVKTVEKWSAEHPQKTRLQDFLEKHPNARLHLENGTPLVTPAVLGYCRTKHCDGCEQIHYTMAHCWSLPLEE